jgi:membrane protein required for colicin V production
MNIIDYIIIGFLLFLIVRGIMRGFIREISSLAGVILGIWLANLYQPWLTGILKHYLPFPQYLPLLSFIIIFVAILVICNILGWSLKLLFSKALMGWFDKSLGAGLAVLKGIIVIYLVIVILTFYIPAKSPLIANSAIAPWIITSYQRITGFISPDHYTKWKNKLVGETKKTIDTVSDKIKDSVKNDGK